MEKLVRLREVPLAAKADRIFSHLRHDFSRAVSSLGVNRLLAAEGNCFRTPFDLFPPWISHASAKAFSEMV